MSAPFPSASDRLRRAIRQRSLDRPVPPDVAALVRSLREKGGEGLRGLLFFGSRRTAAGPDPWSAYDLFVATSQGAGFYRALHRAGAVHRRPALLGALNAVLPPSQVSLWVRDQEPPLHAKCAVIALGDLRRETSPRRRDHFCIGRLFQPAQIVYAAEPAVEDALLDALVNAEVATYFWVRPWLPTRFDAEFFGRRLLEVSLAFEIRPEPGGRARALWEAQRAEQLPLHRLLLEDLRAAGQLEEADGLFALARPVKAPERLRTRLYFGRSLARATLRWGKHVLTFEGWLEYILRKVQRHVGEEIVLTPRERRWPLLLLWPKLVRYLHRKNRDRP